VRELAQIVGAALLALLIVTVSFWFTFQAPHSDSKRLDGVEARLTALEGEG